MKASATCKNSEKRRRPRFTLRNLGHPRNQFISGVPLLQSWQICELMAKRIAFSRTIDWWSSSGRAGSVESAGSASSSIEMADVFIASRA